MFCAFLLAGAPSGRDFLLAGTAERVTRVQTRSAHPQATGALERDPRPFQEEGRQGEPSGDYLAPLTRIAEGVRTYAPVRLHSALQYRTRWDSWRGAPAQRLLPR